MSYSFSRRLKEQEEGAEGDDKYIIATAAEQASKLLDFNHALNITLLDSFVNCMYSGSGDEV